MRVGDKYKNALGDLFYSDKQHQEEMAKITALNAIANKPATTNILVFLIPLAGIIVVGVIAAIVLKRKKS
jgi:predicted class III extradiol MEMO1 family dioxygenase